MNIPDSWLFNPQIFDANIGPTRTRCRLMPRSRRWRMSWVWLSWRLVSCIKIGEKNSTGLNHFGRTMGLNQKKGIFTEIYYQIWRFLRFRDGIYRQIYDRADVFHVTPQMKPCRGIEGMGCLAHLSGEAMILKPDGKAGAISDSCSQLSVF